MKKFLAMLLAMAMVMTMLAGCGGGNEDVNTDGPVKIVFWHSMGSATGELIQEICNEFNASQDEVEVECIYQGDYNTAGTKLQAAASGNTESLPHVVQIEITRVGMYAAADMLLDLKPYADADENFNVNDLYPGVMDFSWYDGKLVSLPNGRSVPVMYYNKDMLKAAGYDKAPATWTEFVDAATKCTKDGVVGYGCPVGDSWYYLALMLTAGGQIYNEAGNNIGFYENGSGAKALQLWKDMQDAGILYLPEGEDYASNSALRNAFMAGSCAITMQSSAQYRGLADNSEFEVGVAYIPKDSTYAAIPGGSNIVAFDGKSEAENEATWKFMSYLCSADVAGKYAAGTGYLPTSDAALNSAIYQEKLAQYPYLDIAVGQLEYYVEMPFDESYTEIKDKVVGKYVQEVIIGGMSVQDAMDNMNKEAGAFYK
ncbi:MAG: ABC transporter substrate-binding protein [Lachnospiraceae bacterium]|nr:ABC transporter substrate-binding protein [Lachnospiraceae bacterium]